jgi:hypothetical protein
MFALKPPAPLLVCGALLAWAAGPAPAQDAGIDLADARWPAKWITCPGIDPRGPVVCHFRKTLAVGRVPASYTLLVSGDNRFVLYVNGVRAGEGPARGDLDHWRYERFDIARLLRPGPNVVAATVWNCGAYAPMAQMGDQTAFIVQGLSSQESEADTDTSWEAEREPGQDFLPIRGSDLNNYYAAAPGEVLDGTLYDWDWAGASTRGEWQGAVLVGAGEPGRYSDASPSGTGSGLNCWQLVPDPLPPMANSEVPIGRVVRGLAGGFPAAIPPHSTASILIDRGTMTTAYPFIQAAGGKGSTVKVTYAEALVDSAGKKGDRNETANRRIQGLNDTFIPDGAPRTWTTLWWRAWRYLQVDVQTGDKPLEIRSVGARYSGYPFSERGAFQASDPLLGRIWETGTRTARMNAHETYMDCAYWEQLQYIGDTRIQALISYVSFGDDRLARQALEAYDDSRTPEGLTESRYPAAVRQVIPTFSLLWIGMLHDYWLYRPDDGHELARWVPHTRGVIDWYASHLRPDGLLGRMPWWNFGDWSRDFDFGVPPQDADGGSALLSLTFVAALRDAADLEASLGNDAIAEGDRALAGRVGKAVWDHCSTPDGLLADTPAHAHFSEQANAMGVLLDVVPKERQAFVMGRVLGNAEGGQGAAGSMSPASIYFRFYVARALDHAGLSARYLDSLGPWRRMLDLGLTTWAETAEPTRSDDHAWSAHPNYDLMTLVAGIRPASPGFRTVLVEPQPGELTSVRATMPHPLGDIGVDYSRSGDAWTFRVTLPKGLAGSFLWNGQSTPLAEGPNTIGPVRR